MNEKDMFMWMIENAERKTVKKPTCKEAFEHRKEFEYVGSGWGYHLYHKIHKDDYISTFAWRGYLWHCISDDHNNIYKVLERFGKAN